MYYASKDYLGNILLLTRQNGTVAEEYSYNACLPAEAFFADRPALAKAGGRRRNPNNWEDYNVSAPAILYRGYTGHEHLDEFALINMNGRVYDPILGRFLSPDNYVQSPDFTQSYNRYAYCVNNPLKYFDPNGEFFRLFLLGFIKGFIREATGHGTKEHTWVGEGFRRGWQDVKNSVDITFGLFKTDDSKNFGGQAWELISRFTWQLPQTIVGFAFSHGINNFGDVLDVNYFRGTTVFETTIEGGAYTIGSYITGPMGFNPVFSDHLFVHEYGHYIQSKRWGIFYLPLIAIPSLESEFFASGEKHRYRWFEAQASRHAVNYFDKHFGTELENYVANSPNFFDRESFINPLTISPYINPRTNQRNYSLYGHPQRVQFHWSDPFLYLYLSGLLFFF
ncbi:MAG: RHS repeat-associated core domain-containing protein [Bacteroidales bacterium]|nr:RHS repeat-associated core domain-containing protein [Bacteroidales bacterium]